MSTLMTFTSGNLKRISSVYWRREDVSVALVIVQRGVPTRINLNTAQPNLPDNKRIIGSFDQAACLVAEMLGCVSQWDLSSVRDFSHFIKTQMKILGIPETRDDPPGLPVELCIVLNIVEYITGRPLQQTRESDDGISFKAM